MLFRKKDKSGTHYPNRPDRAKAVHPGDYYECEPEELGSAIDTFDRIDGPMPAKGAEAVAIAPAPGPMRIVPRGHGWFDVLDSTGRQVNRGAVRTEEAEAIAKGGARVRDEGGTGDRDDSPEADEG